MITHYRDVFVVNTNGHKKATANLANNTANWIEDALFNFIVAGEDTQGKYALVEAVQRQGYEPAPQTYPDTDVTFYIMEGEMTFSVDGQTIAAPAGSNVFINRGRAYSFAVKTETANTLILFSPAISQDVYKKLNAAAKK